MRGVDPSHNHEECGEGDSGEPIVRLAAALGGESVMK